MTPGKMVLAIMETSFPPPLRFDLLLARAILLFSATPDGRSELNGGIVCDGQGSRNDPFKKFYIVNEGGRFENVRHENQRRK